MSLTIALIGNPNCGKTTIFNALTGSNQYVGNWPGVTVEKKEGRVRDNKKIKIVDLPGIYSLSPYTPEEIITRNFLLNGHPDVILNIIDASNIERNLYLTTQLMELNIPVVISLNMMDLVKKQGTQINISKLIHTLGCPIIETSALKQTGLTELIEAIEITKMPPKMPLFDTNLESSLKEIQNELKNITEEPLQRFYSIKLFERDVHMMKQLELSTDIHQKIETIISTHESSLEDDSESILTNARYEFIESIVQECVKKAKDSQLTISHKVDSILTNRWLAFPIFALIMWGIYYISVTSLGSIATDWINDVFFGELVQGNLSYFLKSINKTD